MRVTPKMSDSPTATRNNDEARSGVRRHEVAVAEVEHVVYVDIVAHFLGKA